MRERLYYARWWINLIRCFHKGDATEWGDRVDRAYGIEPSAVGQVAHHRRSVNRQGLES